MSAVLLEGLLLYSISIALGQSAYFYNRHRQVANLEKEEKRDEQQQQERFLSASEVQAVVDLMEQLVQRDEGGRGIAQICLPVGELFQSALEAVRFNPLPSDARHRVAIITGFPCMMDYDPPTETDGPLGAVAIAKALLMLNKTVIIATDECNEEVILACAATMQLEDESLRSNLILESFPPAHQFNQSDSRRFDELVGTVGFVIAIERSGPSADGRYLTMRGKDMSHLIAPLDLMLTEASEDGISLGRGRIRSIGIGKGFL